MVRHRFDSSNCLPDQRISIALIMVRAVPLCTNSSKPSNMKNSKTGSVDVLTQPRVSNSPQVGFPIHPRNALRTFSIRFSQRAEG